MVFRALMVVPICVVVLVYIWSAQTPSEPHKACTHYVYMPSDAESPPADSLRRAALYGNSRLLLLLLILFGGRPRWTPNTAPLGRAPKIFSENLPCERSVGGGVVGLGGVARTECSL